MVNVVPFKTQRATPPQTANVEQSANDGSAFDMMMFLDHFMSLDAHTDGDTQIDADAIAAALGPAPAAVLTMQVGSVRYVAQLGSA